MDLVAAMDDPGLFGRWFSGPSWDGWRAVLRGAFALPMTETERAFFRSVADREPPTAPVRELWAICGRRAGKDSVASLIASHAAALFDQGHRLRAGERALVMCLASDRDQAKIVLGYARAYFDQSPPLAAMVTRETAGCFELENGVDLAIATNNFRATRGRTLLCVVFDEVAFWFDENSARPDKETYRSVVPGLATLPGMLIGISSPYGKSGLLYEKWQRHFGRDGDVLVIRAPSIALNPTLDRTMIEREIAEDPAAASAEWLAEWRSDVASFIDIALIEAAVDRGVTVRPPQKGIDYRAFCDAASGAGKDSFTAAIAHNDDGVAVLDCLLEIRPPFNFDSAVAEVSQLVKSYGCGSEVTSDRYAAGITVQAFERHGVTLRHSERDRSAIYLDVLPLLTSGRARLIENRRMVTQFAALERRTSSGGKDRIDHPQHGGADDVCNSAAGSLVLTQPGTFAASGIFEFYRRGAAVAASNPASGPEFGFKFGGAPVIDTVRLRAPAGISQVTGMSGHPYVIADDGTVRVSPDDSIALRRLGWAIAEEATA